MNDRQNLMKLLKTIWVFRTNVSTRMDIDKLKPLLDKFMNPEDKWNFDLEACDHILRVETCSIQASSIIDALQHAGYRCKELEDLRSFPAEVILAMGTSHQLVKEAMGGY
ncbi:MAG: hypothetical protein SH808_07920 [Saprospiraceae bacterium]|nr:hypothetical protein [Saprospiraceae bacterium]